MATVKKIVESTGEPKKYFCKTCGRTMDSEQFYTSKRMDRYPNDGKLLECKQCLTRHVDNWDPETYKWILEEIDVPYIKEEWDKLLERYGKDRTKMTGMTILGRYLAKMRIQQYSKYTWDDSEKLAEEAKAKKVSSMRASGYTNEQIEEALSKDYTPEKPPLDNVTGEAEPAPMATYEPEFADDLTAEDKDYLTLKWGKMYKPYEWVQLEQFYKEMEDAYDIQTPSHKDYLKLICKTSLKAHQLLDLGDIDGYQKMSKVYDTLMKSSKFTAAQNKAEQGEFINSVSELVLICEKEGFIPRYYTEGPQDKVDQTLQDMRNYVHSLVTEEMNLGNMIEGALKSLKREAEREEDEDIDDDEVVDTTTDDYIKELQYEDYEEYYDELESQRKDDKEQVYKED